MNTPIFLMIVGGVIFLVAFLGCCGAWRESKCLIYTYAFFLAVILVAQVHCTNFLLGSLAPLNLFVCTENLKDAISSMFKVLGLEIF